MSDKIARILEPESIAIVGASNDPAKRGYQALANLRDAGYAGEIYPINPSQDAPIDSLPVYDSVADTPQPADLAFIVTPAHTVPDLVRECGESGVAGAVILAAGFSEVGEDDLEARIVDAAGESGVRLIGPNVLGFVNTHQHVDLGAGYAFEPGELALLSQSGNFGAALSLGAERFDGLGFSFFVSVGNESDVTFDEYLPFLAAHDETSAVVMYVEGMEAGREFLRAAAAFTPNKPIVAIKGGMTDAGQAAAQSHTASLAGEGTVLSDVYEQAGIVRVDRQDELLPVALALSESDPMEGTNVAVITEGGGHATLASDALCGRGLSVPALSPDTQDQLRELLPGAPNYANPVDMMLRTDVTLIERTTEVLLADGDVDAVLVCGLFGGYGSDIFGDDAVVDQEAAVGRRLADLASTHDKPVVVQSEFAHRESAAVSACHEAGLPTYGSVDAAAAALAALSSYGTHRRTAGDKSNFTSDGETPASERVSALLDADRTQLSEYESRNVLREYGVPVGDDELVTSADAAADAVEGYDAAVAMKIVSPDIVHKSDIGGVQLGIESRIGAQEAYSVLVEAAKEHDPDARIDGVLLSPMADEGVEAIVGVTHDTEVGPVVMVGLGGIFTETLEDVAFRGVPVTDHDAREMIEDLDAVDLLHGTRNQDAVAVDALADLVVAVSEIAAANPEIRDLDLNPVIVTPDGVQIVDASIQLEQK